MKWLVLLLGIVSNAAASLTVKYAMTHLPSSPSIGTLIKSPLVVGLALYGAAFVLYALALRIMPINIAYPILVSGAMAIIAVASILLFNEDFTWKTGLGFFLTAAGVFFISQT